MHGVEHAAPAGACREMHQSVEDADDALGEGGLSIVGAVRIDGPIDQKWAAHDGVAIDESPVAAVEAVIAIIAHGEIFVWRHDQFVALNVVPDIVSPFGLDGRSEKLVGDGRECVVQRIVAGRGIVDDVRLVEQFSVDVDLLIDDFEVVAGEADDALHEVRMILIRKFEDDDVAALETAVGKKLVVPLAAAAKDELVDEQVIADEQGAFHGLRRNFEGLNNETGAEEGEDDGDEQRFEIFGERGLIQVYVSRRRFGFRDRGHRFWRDGLG